MDTVSCNKLTDGRDRSGQGDAWWLKVKTNPTRRNPNKSWPRNQQNIEGNQGIQGTKQEQESKKKVE